MSKTSFIVSASESPGADWNLRKTHALKRELAMADLQSVMVQGSYNGSSLVSLFVVPGPQPYEEALNIIRQAALNYEQESVLEINEDGHAWLQFTGRRQKQMYLGPIAVAKDLPPWVESYTILPDGTYIYALGEGEK